MLPATSARPPFSREVVGDLMASQLQAGHCRSSIPLRDLRVSRYLLLMRSRGLAWGWRRRRTFLLTRPTQGRLLRNLLHTISCVFFQFPTPLAASEEQAVIGNVRAIASREHNGINGASPSSVTESLAKTVLREKAAQFDPENHLMSCNSCRKVRDSFLRFSTRTHRGHRRSVASDISVCLALPNLRRITSCVLPLVAQRPY